MARTNLQRTAQKLIGALNFEGDDLTFNSKQFKGKENITMTMYWIGRNVWDAEKHRWDNAELFRSTSCLRIVLYLRDMFYISHNEPLPDDFDEWNRFRDRRKADGDPLYRNWRN